VQTDDEERGRVNVPAEIPKEAEAFIPENAPEIVGMDVEKVAVELTMKTGIPSIFIGHTGQSKTTLLKRVHQELGWPYRGISGRESIEIDNLNGKWRIGKDRQMEYHLGVLPFCMKHGIAVGIQEINYIAPEVLVLIHEFVDEGFITLDELSPDDPDFIIRPHPNFRLYGTMNPPEMYPGARELSPALLRRCIVRTIDDLSKEDELKVITDQVPSVGADAAREMVEVAHSVRHEFNEGKIGFWCSTGDLVQWALLTDHCDAITASEFAVVGKAPDRDQMFVRGRVRLSFNPRSANQPAPADEEEPF
jgi:MoxR-like ATPase